MKSQSFNTILAIESSCDETAASVVEKTVSGVKVLSNIVSSSAILQAKYGGVIPEQAARKQLEVIIPVINETINASQLTINDIDALAVTFGPGLIGSLLVGVETAKTLALVWHKPLIPVNHLIGHFYANWILDGQISRSAPSFPCLGLLVSGGHTDLVLMKGHGQFAYIGGTRDDAAGECFDKCARLLGLSYPGGPAIAQAAQGGNPKAYCLPRPMIASRDFDFSFSGLKTAVANLLGKNPTYPLSQDFLVNLAASIQEAIVDVLVAKVVKAVRVYKVDQIVLAGGVAANQRLKEAISDEISRHLSRQPIFIPPPFLCTDNAVMIAAAALYNPQTIDPLDLQAYPNLTLVS